MICAVALSVCSAGSDKPLSGRELLKTMRRKDRQPAQSSGTRHTPPNKSHPSVSELLDKFAETQDKLQSYIIKSESWSDFNLKTLGRKRRISRICEVRYDGTQKQGNRVKLCKLMWGRVGSRDVSKDAPVYTSWLWDGENYMRYSGVPKGNAKRDVCPGKVRPYMSGKDEIANGRLTSRMYGTALTGYLSGSEDRVEKVLREARNISVRRRTERVGGVKCYVVDADSKHGKHTLWIDPEHGYNIAKAEVELLRGEGHFFYGKPFETAGKKLTLSMENVRFKEVEGIWLPVEADMRYRRAFGGIGQRSDSRTHVKIIEVLLNPDHEALGSFTPHDIPDGAEVTAYVDLNSGFITAWDPKYRWQSDAKLVVDRKGQWVKYEPGKGLLPVVKAVPDLRELELKIKPAETTDKKILLCFCDLGAPASQRAVLALNKLAGRIESQAVVPAVLHCSSTNPGIADTWVRTNDVRLPVGKLQDVVPEILRAWRVEKLPWLVLTDGGHVVTAEGFDVSQAGEKIREAGNAKR